MAAVEEASLLLIIKAQDMASATLKNVEGSAGGLGKTVATAGLGMVTGLAAGGVAAVKMASDFDDAMRQVQTQGGVTAEQMEAWKGQVLDLSSTFGISAKDMASALMPVAAEGFKGADAMKVLGSAAMGAKAFNADLMTTTNALTGAMKDYNFNAGQSQHVMDVLGTAVANGRTSFQALAGSLSTVLPFASASKVSFEGVLGAVTSMTSQNIDADLATQELRFSIAALEKPTKGATAALGEVGLTTKQLVDTMQTGPQGLVNALNLVETHVAEKFPRGSAAYMQALMEIVGGQKGLQPVLALTGQHLDATRQATDALATASKNGGYTQQSWTSVQKDFGTQVEQVRQTVNRYAIELGEHLLPYVSQALGWFSHELPVALSVVQGWWDQNQQSIARVAGIIKQVVEEGLTVLWAVLTKDVVPILQTLWQMVKNDLLPPLDDLWNSFKQNILPVLQQIGGYMQNTVVPQFETFAGDIKPVAGLITDIGVAFGKGMMDAIKWMADHFGVFSPLLAAVVASFVTWKGVMLATAAWELLASLPALFMTKLVPAFWSLDAAMDANPVGAIVLGMGALALAADLIVTHWGPISSFFQGLWSDIESAFVGTLNTIIDGLNHIIDGFDWVGSHLPGPLGFHIGHIPNIQTQAPVTSSGIQSVGHGNLGVRSMQSGGITTSEGLIYAHPNEAIIPLNHPEAQQMLGGGGEVVIHLHNYIDGREVARVVTRHQGRMNRLQGYGLGGAAGAA